ncbi:type II CAAX endopeptidase family protein [Paenibacillus larvae]
MELIWLIISFVSLGIFVKYRPKSYESMLIPRTEAIRLARERIFELAGVDVSTWKAYAMYWHDRNTISRLHQLNKLDTLRKTLFNWGLVESWRIRFISLNNSIIIGLNARGEVTFLNVTVRDNRHYTGEKQEKSIGDIKRTLTQKDSIFWKDAKIIGQGQRTEDLSNIDTYWYLVEGQDLRMKISVQVSQGRIINILSDTEIKTSNIQQVVKKEFRETALNLSGFIGALGATIAGVLSLIYTDASIGSTISVLLAAIIVFAVFLTSTDDVKMGIVNAYDSRLTIKSVYIIGYLSALMAGLAYSCVVFVTSLAGFNLASLEQIPLFRNQVSQITYGVSIGLICLGLFSLLFRILENKGLVRISPELSERSLFLSGFKYRQSISMSIQSSLMEELIFRLLGVSLFIWLFGHDLMAILLTSVLWAFLHQGSGYNPSVYRWSQLVIFGIILGYAYLHVGFLTVLTAHFVHNFILTSLPLFSYKIQIKEGKYFQKIEKDITLN